MVRTSSILSFFLVFSVSVFAQHQDDILGLWVDERQETIIEIYEHEDLYNGRIVWIKDSLDQFGNELRDVRNDDVSLRSRKVIGSDMLLGLKWDEDDTWRRGDIYYYQNGNDYNAKVYLSEEGSLRIKGYYSILFFLGRTKTWSRPETQNVSVQK